MDSDETIRAGVDTAAPVLLVEPDDAAADRLRNQLSEVADLEVVRAHTVHDAIRLVRDEPPSCLLLSADESDIDSSATVRALVSAAPGTAVIVLTVDGDDGLDALAAGAQDCLPRDAVNSRDLTRALRFAVARMRSRQADRHSIEIRAHSDEQARLERGLLPSPLLFGDAVHCATYYRPGRDDAVLGGDFFDVVETRDGRVRAVVGDIMGHGADEAALGVHLRVAWRSLLLAGVDDAAMLPTLGTLLMTEHGPAAHFATVCDIALEGDEATVRLAGHPAPIVVGGVGGGRGAAVHSADLPVGPPLGVRLDRGAGERATRAGETSSRWVAATFPLAVSDSLVIFTDGLLEAFGGGASGTSASLGVEELVQALDGVSGDGRPPTGWVPRLVATAPDEPSDDIAAVVLTRRN